MSRTTSSGLAVGFALGAVGALNVAYAWKTGQEGFYLLAIALIGYGL